MVVAHANHWEDFTVELILLGGNQCTPITPSPGQIQTPQVYKIWIYTQWTDINNEILQAYHMHEQKHNMYTTKTNVHILSYCEDNSRCTISHNIETHNP